MRDYELDDVNITQTNALMENINKQVTELRRLLQAKLDAEAALEKATKEYEKYSRETIPELFKFNGLETLELSDGSRVSIVTKTTCSLNKNDKDKANVAEWLRQQGAGDLVKSELHVPSSQLALVKQAGIIHEEVTTMNTNSVKAYLLTALGQKGEKATITINDLPKGINFYQYDEVEVTRG